MSKLEEKIKYLGYRLVVDNEDCCLYKYETDCEVYFIRFDKLNKNVSKKCMVFHTRCNRKDWIAMVKSKKENEWVLHSTKYGHWAYENTEISLCELDFIIEKAKELEWYYD
jgi:hypothetical protein